MSSTFVSSTEGSVVFPVFEALYLNVPMYQVGFACYPINLTINKICLK